MLPPGGFCFQYAANPCPAVKRGLRLFLAIKVVYGTVRTRVQRTVRVQLSGVLPFFVPYESTFVLSYVRILSTRTRTGTSVRRYLRTYKLSIRHTAVHVRVRVQ